MLGFQWRTAGAQPAGGAAQGTIVMWYYLLPVESMAGIAQVACYVLSALAATTTLLLAQR